MRDRIERFTRQAVWQMRGENITPRGSAGRLGSLVIEQPVAPSPRPAGELCLYKRKGTCLSCVRSCPTGALTPEGLDRQNCYSHLLEAAAHYADLGCATSAASAPPVRVR